MPRKRTVRRRRRRGGLGRLLRPLSVVLAAVAVVAALTLFFKVDKIEVLGNSRYQESEIAAASGVLRGDNLVLLDKYAISQRLCKELPYITEVRVNRKFPDTLLVEVTETKAVASIQGAGGYWLINSGGESGGKLLEMGEAEAAKDYLQLIGLEAVEPAIGKRLELTEGSPVSRERLAALLGAMEDREMFARADNLDFTGPEELILNYDGRFRVEIFYDADFDFKLHCLLEVVARLEPNERGTIRMTLQDDNKAHFIPSAG